MINRSIAHDKDEKKIIAFVNKSRKEVQWYFRYFDPIKATIIIIPQGYYKACLKKILPQVNLWSKEDGKREENYTFHKKKHDWA